MEQSRVGVVLCRTLKHLLLQQGWKRSNLSLPSEDRKRIELSDSKVRGREIVTSPSLPPFSFCARPATNVQRLRS